MCANCAAVFDRDEGTCPDYDYGVEGSCEPGLDEDSDYPLTCCMHRIADRRVPRNRQFELLLDLLLRRRK